MIHFSIEGVALLSVDEVKLGYEENSALVKEEKNENDNQLVISQAANPAPAENLLTTPSVMNIRFVYHTFAHMLP
jgi:hypothetical protein